MADRKKVLKHTSPAKKKTDGNTSENDFSQTYGLGKDAVDATEVTKWANVGERKTTSKTPIANAGKVKLGATSTARQNDADDNHLTGTERSHDTKMVEPERAKATRGGEELQNPAKDKKVTAKIVSYNLIKHEGIMYDLTAIPSKSSRLVEERTEALDESLPVQRLYKDFRKLSQFVRLACCAVVGHAELQIKTGDVLIDVGNICDQTYSTVAGFRNSSQKALELMKVAYGFLREGLETEALALFKQLQKRSDEMCKISEAVLKKCLDNAENVKTLGDETLREKAATTNQKKDTEEQIRENISEQEIRQEKKVTSTNKATNAKSESAKALQEEKDLLEQKRLLSDEKEKKLQEQHEIFREKEEKFTSSYDSGLDKITKESRRSFEKFEEAIKLSNETFAQTIKDLNKEFEEKAKKIQQANKTENDHCTQEYESKVKAIENEYKEKLKRHDETLSKAIDKAESDYTFTFQQIESSYRGKINISSMQLEKELTLNKNNLEAEHIANKTKYEASADACWFAKGKAEEISKLSSENKKASERIGKLDNDAKSKDIKAQKEANSDKSYELQKAYDIKRKLIAQAEKDLTRNKENALQENNLLISQAETIYKSKKSDIEQKKQIAISEAKTMMNDNETMAREVKQSSDERAEKNKKESESINKAEEKNLENQYTRDLKLLQSNYDNAIAEIHATFAEKHQLLDKKYERAKDTAGKFEATRQQLEKETEKIDEELMRFAQKVSEGNFSLEIHEEAITFLEQAEKALRQIHSILRSACTFWEGVKTHCEEVSGHLLLGQISRMQDKDLLERRKILMSDTFKEMALLYYGDWIALKSFCSEACKHIIPVQDEINSYIAEAPTKEEALALLNLISKEIKRPAIASKQ